MEVVKPKMPVAISLKTQHSKHRVNSFSNNLKRNPSRRHRLEIIWEVQRCLPLISLISFLSSLKYSNRFPLRYSKKDLYNRLPKSLHRAQLNSLKVDRNSLDQRSRSLNHKAQCLTISSNLETMVKILVGNKLIQTHARSLVENPQHK